MLINSPYQAPKFILLLRSFKPSHISLEHVSHGRHHQIPISVVVLKKAAGLEYALFRNEEESILFHK